MAPLRMPRLFTRILTVAGLLATLGLFFVLAAMQSRWITQLSETDLRWRKLALDESLRAVRNDVNRELTGAYALFQLDGSPPRESWDQKTAEYYTRWDAVSKFPAVIRRISVAEPSLDGSLALLIFNRKTKKYEPADWPVELVNLREKLKLPFAGVEKLGLHMFTGVVAPASPVLVFPIGYDQRAMFRSTVGWQLIELDHEYLLKKMLPEIIARHVDYAEQFHYRVVESDPPGQNLYSSDAKAAFSNLDAQATILEIAQDYFPHGIGGATPRHQLVFRESIDQRGRVAERVGDAGLWRLQMEHRLGSLDAAVTRMHRGNLLLSLTMIGLVFLDLAVFAMLARRIHRVGESKAAFAAAVSHELRTPIAAICSAADNLAAGIANEPAKVQRYGAAILQQGKQLAEMVEQILAFASGQSRGNKSDPEPVDAADEIREAVLAAGPAARAAGLEIECEIDADLPCISGDGSGIQQAVMNLLTNAIKYARSGGWIRVVASRNASGELEIAVQDNGPGIPASELKRIFEPFYRGFVASTLQVHGSGLGLTIVERAARAHGGRVTVDSTPGRGTRFTLHLPAA